MPSGIRTQQNLLTQIPDSFFTISHSATVNDNRREWFAESDVIPWRQAHCLGMDPNIFFPERGQDYLVELGKSICSICPLREVCLMFALCTGEDSGTWGGTTARERRRHRKDLLKILRSKRLSLIKDI